MRAVLKAAIAACAVTVSPGPVQAANLLTNGSFEEPAVLNSGTIGINQVPDGWRRSLVGNPTNIISNAYVQAGDGFQVLLDAQDGDHFVDLNGISRAGGILQDVAGLTPGDLATLSFWSGRWAQNSAGVFEASISDPIEGVVLAELTHRFSHLPAATSATWLNDSITALVPASGTLRVRFVGDSLSTSLTAPGVDNAVLTVAAPVVPEPMTWSLMIVGFGAIGASMRRWRYLGSMGSGDLLNALA